MRRASQMSSIITSARCARRMRANYRRNRHDGLQFPPSAKSAIRPAVMGEELRAA
jgi:hypothetical protein